jgi:hypothetical protein
MTNRLTSLYARFSLDVLAVLAEDGTDADEDAIVVLVVSKTGGVGRGR